MDDVSDRLQVLPKVELHLHLDCCVSYEAARSLDPSLSRTEYEKHFICPTSNVQTDVYESLEHHPVDRLLEAGVSLGISCDGRTLCNVSLTEEYQRLHDTFGWDTSTFLRTNRAAAEASFAPESVKTRLVEKLLEASGTAY